MDDGRWDTIGKLVSSIQLGISGLELHTPPPLAATGGGNGAPPEGGEAPEADAVRLRAGVREAEAQRPAVRPRVSGARERRSETVAEGKESKKHWG